MQKRLRESLGVNVNGLVPRAGGGARVKKGALSVLAVILRIIISLGIRSLLFLLPVLFALIIKNAYGIAVAIVAGYWLLSVIRCGRMIFRLPSRASESLFVSGVTAVHLLSAAMVVLSLLEPAEDMIYYAVVMASLLVTAGIQIMMILRQNRFATRPVPFFGEEEDR